MNGSYQASWQEYRRWRSILIVLWLGWIPAILLVAYLCGRYWKTPIPIYATIVGWLAAFTLLGLKVGNWPCPRCGKRFFRKGRFDRGSLFTRVCVHCGLARQT